MQYKNILISVQILTLLFQYASTESLQCYVCTDCETNYEDKIQTCVDDSFITTTSQEPDLTTTDDSTISTTDSPDTTTSGDGPEVTSQTTTSDATDSITTPSGGDGTTRPEGEFTTTTADNVRTTPEGENNPTSVASNAPITSTEVTAPSGIAQTTTESGVTTSRNEPTTDGPSQSQTTPLPVDIGGENSRSNMNTDQPPNVQIVDENKKYGSRYAFIRTIREVKNNPQPKPHCVVTSYEEANRTVVYRGCSFVQEDDPMKHCNGLLGDSSIPLTRCMVCDQDRCNSATKSMAGSMILIITIIMAFKI